MTNHHLYKVELQWNGNTSDPKSYNRNYTIRGEGEKELSGSSDSYSKGDKTKWNPEEMLLASISSCHMLWYLYLCAASKIVITEYKDMPSGVLTLDPNGKSSFTEATLNPIITIEDISRKEEALALQYKAHEKCYIVNSLNFDVKIQAQVIGS